MGFRNMLFAGLGAAAGMGPGLVVTGLDDEGFGAVETLGFSLFCAGQLRFHPLPVRRQRRLKTRSIEVLSLSMGPQTCRVGRGVPNRIGGALTGTARAGEGKS
jgi:hypothetical protein